MSRISDRDLIEKIPCSFCGAYKIGFVSAEGYESHFSDSDFNCLNCGCSYPVGLFYPQKTLTECRDMMKKRAAGYYQSLMEDYKEKSEIVTRIKKRLEMYESNYNPSKRDKLGK